MKQPMQDSYRNILRQSFEERHYMNPSYSMRSFARDLGLAPSSLSEILKGRKGLSPKRSMTVARALKLPDWQVRYFQDLVTKEYSRNPTEGKKAVERLRENSKEIRIKHLKSEASKALTSWIDLAILEFTHLNDFQGSCKWIAEQMKQPLSIIEKSVSRLQAVNLLKVEGNQWQDLSPFFTTTDGMRSQDIQNFHKEVLTTFSQKLQSEDLSRRVMKTVVFSIEDSQVAEAKAILDEAISKIVNLSAKASQERDHVICFSSQLFFVSPEKRKKT